MGWGTQCFDEGCTGRLVGPAWSDETPISVRRCEVCAKEWNVASDQANYRPPWIRGRPCPECKTLVTATLRPADARTDIVCIQGHRGMVG